MKKVLLTLCSLAVLLSQGNVTAYAESPVPVDVDPVVYEKLLATTWICDPNQDGIVTEEELRSTDRLTIDMDGVTDLSWLKYLDNCELLSLKGGTITDYSALKELPKLEDLQMRAVPVTDISFAKDMNLENFSLNDMEQITLEQRMEIARWEEEVTIEAGFMGDVGVKPRNILGDNFKCYMSADDKSVARSLNVSGIMNQFYAVAPGETTFRVYMPDNTEVISGKIIVTETNLTKLPLEEGTCTAIRDTSFYYDTTYVALQNGTLYSFNGSEVSICEENVKAYDSGYRIPPDRIYQYFDAVVKTDGTLLLNKKLVPDMTDCVDIQNECIITKDGGLYGIYPDGKNLTLIKIAEDFKEFAHNGKDFYINQNGEVIAYFVKYDENDKPYAVTQSTGIMNPVSMHGNFFVDENHVLWQAWLDVSKNFGIRQLAESAVEVNDYLTENGTEYAYLTEDGRYLTVFDQDEITPLPDGPERYGYLDKGRFYIYQYKDEEQGKTGYLNWFLTLDHVLTIDNYGQHVAVSDVAFQIDSEYDKELQQGYIYFFRLDGSMWRYCFETQMLEEMIPAETHKTLSGDVSNDGIFNVSDVILLQKYLHGQETFTKAQFQTADLTQDGKVNIFDFIKLKYLLLEIQ